MKKSKRKTAAKGKRSTGLSRRVLNEMLTDLIGRIDEQAWAAEAISKVAAPTRDTLVGAFPALKVLELAADRHSQKMREIHRLAGRLAPRAA